MQLAKAIDPGRLDSIAFLRITSVHELRSAFYERNLHDAVHLFDHLPLQRFFTANTSVQQRERLQDLIAKLLVKPYTVPE
jgi:hypothetical protein